MRLQTINKKIAKLKQEIMKMDYLMRGSIIKTYLKCGKKECICHRDPTKLHGPYYVFTKKVKGKTVTRHYTEKEAKQLEIYLRQYNEAVQKIREISELSEEAISIILNQNKNNRPKKHD